MSNSFKRYTILQKKKKNIYNKSTLEVVFILYSCLYLITSNQKYIYIYKDTVFFGSLFLNYASKNKKI